MNNKLFDVLVIGELNVDLILNKIASFPTIGKEILAKEMDLTLGSSSAIFASNLSSLNTKVAFLGKIGKDMLGDFIIKELQKKGVDTRFIIEDGEQKTGATIALNYGNDRAMVTHPGAMEKLSLLDIAEEKLNSARHLHLASPFLQPQIKVDIIGIFKMAKELGLTTSLDTQWDPEEKWEIDLQKLLPFVDIFLPNEEEIKKLTKTKSVEDAIEKIKDFSPNAIIVKKGKRGSTLFDDGRIINKDAYLNKDVVDAIGAGDSFDAGFIHKYVQGSSLEDCQDYGNFMGALNTTAAGGTKAFETYEIIMETFAKYSKIKKS